MPTPRPSRRCSASPACRRRAAAGSAPMLTALFADEAAATEAATLLLAQDWAAGRAPAGAAARCPTQDWVRADAVAVRAGGRSRPTSGSCRAGTSRRPTRPQVIRLDPGLAFGTGTHPTTRMCLRWTAQQAPSAGARWSRVLDYGCGSGILAIGAALHGARHIDAVDIDPAAVESTRANAQANGVRAERRPARRGAGRLRAGARQHPGHAAEAAGAAAVRARGGRRRPGAGRHPGAPGRRIEAGLRALAARCRSATPRTAGS